MVAYTVCPHCGFHEASDKACSQCGIVFEKFYGRQPRPPARANSNAAIIAEFQKRRARAATALLIMALVALPMVFFGTDDPSRAWYWIIVFVVVAGAIAFSVSDYRCPACNTSALEDNPRPFNPAFCPTCGVRLQSALPRRARASAGTPALSVSQVELPISRLPTAGEKKIIEHFQNQRRRFARLWDWFAPNLGLYCPVCGTSMYGSENDQLNPNFCSVCGTRLK